MIILFLAILLMVSLVPKGWQTFVSPAEPRRISGGLDKLIVGLTLLLILGLL